MERKATPADLPAYQALWQQAFGDDADFAAMVFERFAGCDNVFVAEQGGQLTAILSAVPCTLKDRPGAYFYGLATHPAHRGKGVMSALMAFAEKELQARGASFVTLIPAGEPLFDFYQKRGYQKAFGLRSLSRPIRRNLWAQAEFDSCTANQLMTLRKRFCPDSVQLPPASMVEVFTDLYKNGATIVSNKKGYAVYFVRGERLEVVEIFAESDRDGEELLETARGAIGAEQADITVGADSTMFLGEGKRRDYGMIKLLGAPIDLYECYMRLMLDN